jgi:hypothetical protein
MEEVKGSEYFPIALYAKAFQVSIQTLCLVRCSMAKTQSHSVCLYIFILLSNWDTLVILRAQKCLAKK